MRRAMQILTHTQPITNWKLFNFLKSEATGGIIHYIIGAIQTHSGVSKMIRLTRKPIGQLHHRLK